ncbi:MAG: GTP diphosphokinase [Idiomarina sp.]|nr:GTP diphosphokinase [Idiomarina sp.]
MVQVRSTHVDKGIQRQGGWLQAVPKEKVRHTLARFADDLAQVMPQSAVLGEPAEALLKGEEMVEILAELNLDKVGLQAALCIPAYESGVIDDDWLVEKGGEPLVQMVHTVHQMQSISELQHFQHGKPNAEQIDTVRRMLLAMVEDVRAVLVKLAERICHLRLLKNADEEERVLAAKECSEIYAPLANRLGIGQLKWEIEDLAFRYLHPQTYKQIARQLDEKRLQREAYIDTFVNDLQAHLDAEQVDAKVYGRPKHIYSIWRKMHKKGLDFSELFDIRAVRIVTHSLKDCYGALGVVHTRWRHLASEFDDYVATPKANGYQSIHTVVIGPEQKNVEIQIRSEQMHDDAEMGVAAHWMYKEGAPGGRGQGYEEKIAWLRKLLAWHEDMAENDDLVQEIRSQVFEDRVYVFTPKGDVIDLPAGSTPLDFAYYIHSQVGHRCIGAKVDGRIVPFTYNLGNGERVEILTQKEPSPRRDWMNPALGYLNSARARNKVQTFFKKLDRDKHIQSGKELLEAELARQKLHLVDAEKAVARFNMTQLDDLLAAIGAGDIGLHQVVNYLKPVESVDSEEATEQALKKIIRKKPGGKATGGVQVEGIGNLMMSFARCCQPLPGDPIMGYVTQGRGVSVHQKHCEQLAQLLQQNPARGIDVKWSGGKPLHYEARIMLEAMDRSGLLHEVTTIMSNEKVNVGDVQSRLDHAKSQVTLTLTLYVHDNDELQRVLTRLRQLSDILSVQRL